MTEFLKTKKSKMPCYSFNTVIVGSGAAGYNAADWLFSLGQSDIAVVTEGRKMGTSRNTGSDKQTYYKLTTSGEAPDSVYDMAKTLFAGGSVNGDTALIEASNSLRSFYKLVNLGVPFPINDYGEHIGYRTDNDNTTRAASAGPLTSKYITEALERSVFSHGTPVFDGYRVVKIFTEKSTAYAILALNPELISKENPAGCAVFSFTNLIWATGGPSAIYDVSVYPESQTCAHGAALEAGAAGASLTESQYGIASVKFRWNLSGTYQQAIPRYFSTDKFGNGETEFLNGLFESGGALADAVFGKGYGWPFDPRHICENGKHSSSAIDIAVFAEKLKGRRVFIDFRRNPSVADKNGVLDFNALSQEALDYLKHSEALLATPCERLKKMNSKAFRLFYDNGIDLSAEPLEIDVCAQHNNGGLAVNGDWESVTLSHFFAAGECAGTFGVYRPGGAALNSGQVGSLRAAQKIVRDYSAPPMPLSGNIKKEINDVEDELLSLTEGTMKLPDILFLRSEYGRKMMGCAAFIRSYNSISRLITECKAELDNFYMNYSVSDPALMPEVMINRDVLITQYVYLSAIKAYIEDGGLSRGSYMITDLPPKAILASAQSVDTDTSHSGKIQYVLYNEGKVISRFKKVSPIPASDYWFENIDK